MTDGDALPAATLMVNDVIPDPSGAQYRIVRHLGVGQYGEVFAIVDSSRNNFALKVAHQGAGFLTQAQREADILALIQQAGSHRSHVVSIHSSFTFRGRFCIVLELLSSNLYSILRRRRFIGIPLPFVQSIARDLFESLAVFGECGIVHGDLKPESREHEVSEFMLSEWEPRG
jgi:dual specificity protein kinase YAK1